MKRIFIFIACISSGILYQSCSRNASYKTDFYEPKIYEGCINVIIPMSDYAEPAPYKVSTNSEYPGDSRYSGWKAFDDDHGWTAWVSNHNFRSFTETANIMYDFTRDTKIVKYSIRCRNDYLNDRSPKKWIVQGSSNNIADVNDPIDSSNWVTIDERENYSISKWMTVKSFIKVYFDIQNPEQFSKYRMCVFEVNGSSVVDIVEIAMYKNP